MKRIVITGIGVVSPIGLDAASYYQGLLTGDAPFAVETGGYSGHGDGCLSARLGAAAQAQIAQDLGEDGLRAGAGVRYGIHAALQAVADAAVTLDHEVAGAVPVYMGNSEGDPEFLERFLASDQAVESTRTAGFESDAIPRAISRRLGLAGPAMVMHNTCASSNIALDAAVREIQSGRCRVALCGASDPFSLKIWTGFSSLKCLSSIGCKPFAEDRKTIVIAEGAFVFVLEDRELAVARGARIYAEVLGAGISNDAGHLTNPDQAGVKLAITRALADARVKPEDIDFIFAHGTGTIANDRTEDAVLADVFGRESIPPVAAIKSTIGHMMAAAGAANVAAACLTFRHGQLPPSKHSEPADPTLHAPVVKGRPLATGGRIALVNAFGFGGNNAVVVLAGERP